MKVSIQTGEVTVKEVLFCDASDCVWFFDVVTKEKYLDVNYSDSHYAPDDDSDIKITVSLSDLDVPCLMLNEHDQTRITITPETDEEKQFIENSLPRTVRIKNGVYFLLVSGATCVYAGDNLKPVNATQDYEPSTQM